MSVMYSCVRARVLHRRRCASREKRATFRPFNCPRQTPTTSHVRNTLTVNSNIERSPLGSPALQHSMHGRTTNEKKRLGAKKCKRKQCRNAEQNDEWDATASDGNVPSIRHTIETASSTNTRLLYKMKQLTGRFIDFVRSSHCCCCCCRVGWTQSAVLCALSLSPYLFSLFALIRCIFFRFLFGWSLVP